LFVKNEAFDYSKETLGFLASLAIELRNG